MTTSSQLYPKVETLVAGLNTNLISKTRIEVLQPLINYIQAQVNKNNPIRLNFICTHNSRRSHLSQVWAQTLAHYFNIANVFSYSGGTESTALFPVVVETLKQAGFKIKTLSTTTNPVYSIRFNENAHPIIGFSKAFDDSFNPKSNFAAILTCSQADKGCPFIAGSDVRIPIAFEDPKAFDNTPQQAEKYNERSLQIATELYFVFSQIQS